MITYLLSSIMMVSVILFLCGTMTYWLSGSSTMAAGGKAVLESALVVIFVYLAFSTVYTSGIDYEGVPFACLIDGGGTLKELWQNDPKEYLFNLMELVTLSFVFGLISCFFPASKVAGSNKIAIVIYYVGLVLGGLAVNHYVIQYAKNNDYVSLGTQIIEGIITGGVVTMTPAMIATQLVTRLTDLSTKSPFVLFMATRLPDSKLGIAIKNAFSSSMVFLLYLYVVEKHMGSLFAAAGTIGDLLTSLGSIALTITMVIIVFSAVFR